MENIWRFLLLLPMVNMLQTIGLEFDAIPALVPQIGAIHLFLLAERV